jgi:hypothetical protein
MKSDTLHIEITPDGQIKIDSDGISMPNHAAAEAFVRALTELAGGTTTKTRKATAHTHAGHRHTHGAGEEHGH